MSSYICTQCGYHIAAEEGVKVGVCPACQSLFVFPNQFAQKENLYRLAAEARLNGNYDMALNYYSRILRVDAAEPEANWGYLLSKYGIDISNDALDYGNILFHRVEHTSFMGDPAYERMIACVPQASRYYYEGKSREIEAQHKKLLAISAAMQAPDLYIDCTAEPGTQDFLLSAQVGKALEDAGYRVFHPGMLNGVARRDYNLYEMAAAEKAQAMLVVFTRDTNQGDVRFQAVWKRFLAYRKQDAGRKMLSVFQGLRLQALPLELQSLQSIFCEGSDFSDKVLNEINAMFGRQSRSAALIKENLRLLRDGQDAMDRRDFNQAFRFFEKAAANDAHEFHAHWGMVCARTKGLTTPVISDEVDQSYQQAYHLAKRTDKAAAAKYRTAMSELMQDAVWEKLLQETDDLKDWDTDAERKAKKAVDRVNLYLPPMDPRFQELEDWRQAIKRQRELDALSNAYSGRDVSVEPFFAEQDKAEYAYSVKQVRSGGALSGSGIRDLLSGISLILLLTSYLCLLMYYIDSYELADTGYFHVSRWLLFAGLMLAAVWIGLMFQKLKIFALPAALVVMLILFHVTKHSVKQFRLIYIIAVLLLFLFDRVYVMMLARATVKSSKAKVKAWDAVKEVEQKLAASWQAALQEVNDRYPIPAAAVGPWPVTHSEYYKEPAAKENQVKGPAGYLARTVLFLAALAAGFTLVNNVCYTRGLHDAVDMAAGWYHVVILKSDGTAAAAGRNQYGQCEVSGWKDLVALQAGGTYSAGLTEYGTVLVASDVEALQEASAWTDIVAISGSYSHLAGLKSDGTVVVASENAYGECDTEDWQDVIQVLAVSGQDSETTIGVCSDGSLLIAGTGENWEEEALYAKESFGPEEGLMQAQSVTGTYGTVVVFNRDGSIVGLGSDAYFQITQMQGWNTDEVTAAESGREFLTLGLKTDGTVISAGSNTEAAVVAEWTDIVDISVGITHAIALKSDGTVVSAGVNSYGQLDTEDWKNVVQIYAGPWNSYALTESGKLISYGYKGAGLTYTQPRGFFGAVQFWINSLQW